MASASCCRRCDAVARFFNRLKMPDCGIDFSDEPDDLAQLLISAAAFGCAKPKPVPKLVPRKVAVPVSKISRESCAPISQKVEDQPPVNVVEVEVEEIVNSSQPAKTTEESLQQNLETSDMDVENEASEKRMVDAATSYYCPVTPGVQQAPLRKSTVATGKKVVGVDVEIQASEKSLMALAVPQIEESDFVLPSPVLPVPPQSVRRKSAGVQAFGNSPIASYLARKSGSKEQMKESPLIRHLAISRNNVIVQNSPSPQIIDQPQTTEQQENVIPASITEASSASIVSAVHPEPVVPGKAGNQRARAKSVKPRPSRGDENPAEMFPGLKNLPCIILPSPALCRRYSQRVRVFGNCGIVRHSATDDVVGVLCCSRSELARIQQAAEPLMSKNQPANQPGQEVGRQLNAELADGSGRISLAPPKNSRHFGLFYLSSAGRPSRLVQSGFFKFTVIRLKGDHVVLTLRGARFNFKIGGQFAIQPGDDYAMEIFPNKKNNEAVLAFDYVLAAKTN